MKIVIVNNRQYTVNNPKLFVLKLELSRKAIVTWDSEGNCTIVDNGVSIDRPIENLSTGNVGYITRGIA